MVSIYGRQRVNQLFLYLAHLLKEIRISNSHIFPSRSRRLLQTDQLHLNPQLFIGKQAIGSFRQLNRIFKIKDNTGVIAQQFQCVRNRSSYNRAPTAYSIYKCPAYRLMRVTRSE